MFSDIILINSNPNNKHLQNRNFVYINEREVVQNVKITCAASDIDHKCIWSIELLLSQLKKQKGIKSNFYLLKSIIEQSRLAV